jgi:hypothetical protein
LSRFAWGGHEEGGGGLVTMCMGGGWGWGWEVWNPALPLYLSVGEPRQPMHHPRPRHGEQHPRHAGEEACCACCVAGSLQGREQPVPCNGCHARTGRERGGRGRSSSQEAGQLVLANRESFATGDLENSRSGPAGTHSRCIHHPCVQHACRHVYMPPSPPYLPPPTCSFRKERKRMPAACAAEASCVTGMPTTPNMWRTPSAQSVRATTWYPSDGRSSASMPGGAASSAAAKAAAACMLGALCPAGEGEAAAAAAGEGEVGAAPA